MSTVKASLTNITIDRDWWMSVIMKGFPVWQSSTKMNFCTAHKCFIIYLWILLSFFSLRFTYQTFSCCFITLDGLLRFSNEGSFTFSGFLSFSPSFFSPSFFSDASLFFSSYATKYHNNVLTNFQKKKHKWIHLEEILWRQRKWRDFLKSCDLLAIQELD